MNCLDTAWKQHAAELRSWLRHRMAQSHDVDDMMQDLFMEALCAAPSFSNVTVQSPGGAS